MLLFTHVGIAAATAKLVDIAFPSETSGPGKRIRYKISSLVNRFRDADNDFDYRMIIIGSMLPDIIDKPLALIMNNSVYFSGRGIFHSLLFNLLLLFGGIVFKKTWLKALWFGGLTHLLLDFLWRVPVTLFWPFLGWFPLRNYDMWLSDILRGLVTHPEVFIPEIVGFIVIVFFASRILRGNGIMQFIKNGKIR